jgi:trimeric autotransporter adhesin
VDRHLVTRGLCACALILLLVSTAGAQNINTIAGGGPNNLPATSSAIGTPWKVVQQGSSNVFFISDPFTNRVFEVNNGTVTVVAGNIVSGYTADGQAATVATMNRPLGIAVDNANGLYIADSRNNVIRYVNTGSTATTLFGGAITVNPGEITTIVGTGTSCDDLQNGSCGDGGSAVNAELFSPSDVFVDASGDIYVADTGDNVIRVVNAQSSPITIDGVTVQPGDIAAVAGSYNVCTPSLPEPVCGDTGPATSANLQHPMGVWLDSNSNIYIADTPDQAIRLVNAQTGIINVFAGNYVQCTGSSCGDGGSATSASLSNPTDILGDGQGNIYIADTGDEVARVVNSGNINLLAGTYATACTQAPCGDGGAATAALLSAPTGVLVDTSSNLYIADQNDDAVREIANGSSNIATAFGIILDTGYSGDGNPATRASLYTPSGTAADAAGNVYIADTLNNAVRVVNNQKAAITIAKVSIPAGAIATIAGTGQSCSGSLVSCGDGGPASAAQLADPTGVALDAAGNIYIADSLDSVIRKVNAQSGIINTVAGNGQFGYAGDDGLATQAKLDAPFGVSLDRQGNIYIADGNPLNINGIFSNNIIRVVNTQATAITVAGISIPSGDINTVAGTALATCTPSTNTCGDGGPATQASFTEPTGLAVDGSGNIYIADFGDNRVRFVNNTSGLISTVAGNGTPCPGEPCGDGGGATSANLDGPFDVSVDLANNVYVADLNDDVVRSFTVGGNIKTVVGSYADGFFGDGGPATGAALAQPAGLGADSNGNLFVTDVIAFRVRKVNGLVATLPTAATSPNPLALPATIVSDTNQAVITITNNGIDINLAVSSITVSGTNASDFKESNNCTTVAPGGGTCTVTITFTPSASGARSATLMVNDNAANSPQTVALSGTGVVGLEISPTSQSVSPGSSTTYSITVPSQGFSGSMTLSCTSALPSGAACSFSPSTVAPGKTSTLTISTTAPTSGALIAPVSKRSSAPLYAFWLLLPAMLLSTAGLTAPKRKKLISYFLLTLAIAGVLFLVACGGGSGSSTSGGGGGGGGTPTGGTPAGTYKITVQGKAGATTATQQVTLTVQ